MQRTPKILIVSADSRLKDEVAAALRDVADVQPVLHYAAEYRQGIEAIRSWRPFLVLVEMSDDLRALKVFAEEAGTSSPETNLATVFRPEIFGHDTSESAVLIEALRAGMQDFLRRPISRADLTQLLDRLQRRAAQPVRTAAGKIISFLSNKGGVGKSTLAVNIAAGLATRFPERVLLIDASLQLGVCATLLDLKPATTMIDAVRQRHRLDETLIRQLAVPHACGLHLLAAPQDALEAAEVDEEPMARILTLARRTYDYVLVDTFPLLDRVMMAVLDLSDRVFLVTESVVPTLLGMVSLIRVLDNLGFAKDRQRLILNRHSRFAGNLAPDDVARRLGRAVDYVVPYQKKLLIASNIGKPYVLGANNWWGVGKVLGKIIDELPEIPSHLGSARSEDIKGAVESSPSKERETA
jgi:pilus assembly protein CpaE